MKFNCFITGEDFELLRKDTPKSKQKVVALTTALFVPVLFWFLSTFLLVFHVFQEQLWVALLAGFIASFFIFLIERIIIMSNGSKAMISFRIMIGLVIATLGSLSIDEVIFKEDVDQQMMREEQQRINEGIAAAELSFEEKINKQEELVDQKNGVWKEALKIVQAEADGTGGSGTKGVSSITKLKMNQASLLEDDYRNEETKLEQLRSSLENEKIATQTRIEQSFSHNALLHRIDAMFELVLQNRLMMAAYILFTLLFLAMEFLVVVLKLFLPKTHYEKKKEAMEIIGERRLNSLIAFDNTTYKPDYNNTKVKKVNKELKMIGLNSTLL